MVDSCDIESIAESLTLLLTDVELKKDDIQNRIEYKVHLGKDSTKDFGCYEEVVKRNDLEKFT